MAEFFLMAVAFIGGLVIGTLEGGTRLRADLLKDKHVCYAAQDAGLKFEKCYQLVEEQKK